MLRTDLLAQHRLGGHLAYFEVKTTGWESDAWAEQWETKPQLGLGTLDLDKRYGREVTECFIVGLNKGSRKKDTSKESLDAGSPLEGMKRQQSALAYGYRRAGNPPLAKDDWNPAYEWITDAGEVKRKSKAHQRTGVWHLAESDWSIWKAYSGDDPEMTPEEFWVRQLPMSILDKVVFVLGPLNPQAEQVKSLRLGMLGEEKKWQMVLWQLYDERLRQPNQVWGDPNFHLLIDQLIPRSWNCRPFGKEHQCEFVPLCFKHAGWEDPLSMGRYQLRRPHHAPETEQAVARGLLVAEAAEIEEE